jgi:DNA-binding NtrC family response regulator
MGGTGGTLRVLIVDDDAAFRESLVRALSALDVSAVATPAEAIWALSKQPYDVMICDLRLGTTASGDDVLEMVRTEFPRVARILITGAGGAVHDTPHSAHAVLYKPLDLAALRDLLSWIPHGSPENGG